MNTKLKKGYTKIFHCDDDKNDDPENQANYFIHQKLLEDFENEDLPKKIESGEIRLAAFQIYKRKL